MTLRLILMRHAKSDWSLDGGDHERPLNPRGRRAATVLGQWLVQSGYSPDTAVVSDAVRTRQTWELLKLDATVRFERDLYLADPRVMFETLQACDTASVLIIGHNPGIAEFSRNMLADVPAHNRFDDYPTGATLIADFAIDSWSEVSQETGRAVDFIVPRDLIAS